MNPKRPVVGVDVGKEHSWYAIMAPDGHLLEAKFKATNDEHGFAKVFAKLNKITEAFGISPAIVIESTGHYSARPLELFIRNSCTVFLINPLLSHSIKSSRIRKVKTDKMDCEDLARLYFLTELREYSLSNDKILDLKVLCRTMQRLSQQRVDLINQLTAALEQVWPGYMKVFRRVASSTSLAILQGFSNPQDIINADATALVALISSHSRRSSDFAEKIYQQLLASAKEAVAIGITRAGSIKVVEIYAHCLKHILAEMDKLQTEIDKYSATIPEVQLLTSIPGIGAKIAATLTAEIGDISRFKNYKQLVAYCGIDPRVFQSGNFIAVSNKVTKRGSPYLRRALYLAATVAIRKDSKGNMVNPIIYGYYQHKILSKARKQALGAVMNKLTRIIFSVLKHQKPFELPAVNGITPFDQIIQMKIA